MEQRKAPDLNASGLMVLFCLILGLQQVVLKAAAEDIAPILQIAIRSGIAAVLVWGYMRLKRERVSLGSGNWRPGLVVGLLFALEYFFLGEALRFTSASRAVVFLYTAPVFAALILHFLIPSERMNRLQWGGVALAFLGTALAFLGDDLASVLTGQSDTLLGDALAMLAGAAWGATTVVIRASRLSEVSPRETLLYQLIMAFVLLVIGAAATQQLGFVPSAVALASLAFQSVVVAFVAFLIWFWLLRTYHASPIGIMSFMTPIFGVFLGAWLLSEPVEMNFLVGSLLAIAGVILISGEAQFRRLLDRALA